MRVPRPSTRTNLSRAPYTLCSVTGWGECHHGKGAFFPFHRPPHPPALLKKRGGLPAGPCPPVLSSTPTFQFIPNRRPSMREDFTADLYVQLGLGDQPLSSNTACSNERTLNLRKKANRRNDFALSQVYTG